MFQRSGSQHHAGPARPVWLIVALTALLGVLGAGLYGRTSGLAQNAAPQNPYTSTPALIAEGRELYLDAGCYACHGLDATGRGELGPRLTELQKTDAELHEMLMEIFKGKVTSEELWKILTYLRSLAKS